MRLFVLCALFVIPCVLTQEEVLIDDGTSVELRKCGTQIINNNNKKIIIKNLMLTIVLFVFIQCIKLFE